MKVSFAPVQKGRFFAGGPAPAPPGQPHDAAATRRTRRLRLAADGRDGLGRGRHGACGAGQWAVGAFAGTSMHQALPTLAELPTLERVGLRRLETLPDDYR